MSEIDFRLLTSQLKHLDIVSTFTLRYPNGSNFHFLTYLYNGIEFSLRVDDAIFDFNDIKGSITILQNFILNDMTMVHYLLFNTNTYRDEINSDYLALSSKIYEGINFFEIIEGREIEDKIPFDKAEDYISSLFFEEYEWLDIYIETLEYFNIDFSQLKKIGLFSLIANSPISNS